MSSSVKEKILFDLFPPPRFLEMPAVGIDISDTVVRFAGLTRRHSHRELSVFGQQDIPAGVVDEGYIKNKETLVKILSDIKAKHSLDYIHATLPEDKGYLFRIQIPFMADADIRSALGFKIEENVPISLAEAVYDYTVINRTKEHINLSVAVVHTKVVSTYLDAFRAAGLRPLSFKLESEAVARASIPPDQTGAFIVVALREEKTIVAIVSMGVVQFSATVSVGGKSITESIKKNFSVDEQTADNIRNGSIKKEKDEVLLSLANSASVLRDEISRLVVYWQSHSDEKIAIEKIVLSGSDALLGIDDYLVRSLDIPAVIAEPWRNIAPIEKYVPPLSLRQSLDYIAALGLCLS